MRQVLHVLNSIERSGMEMMLLSSADEWNRNGYSCDVLASANSIGPLAGQLHEAGYGVYHIPLRGKYRYIPAIRFLWRFYRLCRSGYHVIHIHTETAVPIFVIVARMAGIRRIVLTPHNTFQFTGLLRARKIFERWLMRKIGGRYGMISDGVQACEWNIFRNSGVRTWNWIDTKHFRPASSEEWKSARDFIGCDTDKIVILSIGNCSTVKNHTEILRAILLLPSGLNALYLHVGKEEVGRPEKILAEALGIQQSVRFCDSQDSIRNYLWAADIFVMPSLREGLSIAAIEAIASATPSIFADIPGLSEIADLCKFVYRSSSTAYSIANGIEHIAATPREERRLRAVADSERVRSRFSVERGVYSIVCGLYNDSLEGASLRGTEIAK